MISTGKHADAVFHLENSGAEKRPVDVVGESPAGAALSLAETSPNMFVPYLRTIMGAPPRARLVHCGCVPTHVQCLHAANCRSGL